MIIEGGPFGAVTPLPVLAVAVLVDEVPTLSLRIGLEVPDDSDRSRRYIGRGGRYVCRSGRYVAVASDLNIVEVELEHVGYVIVTDSDLYGLALILAEVEGVLSIAAGHGEIGADLHPSALVSGPNEHTDNLSGVGSILTLCPEAELTVSTNREDRSYSPVIGSKSAPVVDVRSGHHVALALMIIEGGPIGTEAPLPVLAVAVLVDEGPTLSLRIGLEVPDDADRSRRYIGRGGRYITGEADDAVYKGVLDGSSACLVDGHIAELSNVGGDDGGAGSISGYREGKGNESTLGGDTVLGADHTDEDGARGVGIDVDHSAVNRVENVAADSTYESKDVGVVGQGAVEDMSLTVFTVDIEVDGDGGTGLYVVERINSELSSAGLNGNRSGSGRYLCRSGRYIGRGGRNRFAAGGNLDIVHVELEHIGYMIVTDSNAYSLSGISGEIYGVLSVSTGGGVVTAYLDPVTTAGIHEYTEYLSGVGSILALCPEGELTVVANYEDGGHSPVIRGESADVVDVGSGHDVALTLMVVEVCPIGAIAPLPVIAVAVLVDELPALSIGIGFEVPNGGAEVLEPGGDGGVNIDGLTVVIPTGEGEALMLGNSGEVSIGKNGAARNGESTEDSAVVTVNEGYGSVFNGNVNGEVVLDVEAGNFHARAADSAEVLSVTGLGIDTIQIGIVGVKDLSPVDHTVVEVIGHGLYVSHRNAGLSNEGRSTGLEVDGVQSAGLVLDGVGNAVLVDGEGHRAVHAGDGSDVGNGTGAEVDYGDVTGVTGAGDSVHMAASMIVSHGEDAIGCGGAGEAEAEGLSIHNEVTLIGAAVLIQVAVDVAAREGSREGGITEVVSINDGRGIGIGEVDELIVVRTAKIVGAEAVEVDKGVAHVDNGYINVRLDVGIINGGDGDVGLTGGNTGNDAVRIYGSDGGIVGGEDDALIERGVGEDRPVDLSGTVDGNLDLLVGLDGGDVDGLTDVDVINGEVVAGGVYGRILRVGPGESMRAGGKAIRKSLPIVVVSAVGHNNGAVNSEVAVIPEGVGAFTPSLEIELDDIALGGDNVRSDRGGGGGVTGVAGLRIDTVALGLNSPRIGGVVSEVDGTAFNVESGVEVAGYGNLSGGRRGSRRRSRSGSLGGSLGGIDSADDIDGAVYLDNVIGSVLAVSGEIVALGYNEIESLVRSAALLNTEINREESALTGDTDLGADAGKLNIAGSGEVLDDHSAVILSL